MQGAMSEITAALVQQAVAGNRKALEEILRRVEKPFFNLAVRMGLEPDEAEDAAQECLLRLATRLAQFDGRAKFSTWAWKVAVGRILDLRDQREGRAKLTFAVHASALADGLRMDAPERPDDKVELGELKMRCDRALLLCLDSPHRAAFVLGHIFELEGAEASDILGISEAAFRKRLSRARARLEEALQANCGIVNPGAGCRCHRRLQRARELGRVAPGKVTTEAPLDVAALREKLAGLDRALRPVAYYQADPPAKARRDLVREALSVF